MAETEIAIRLFNTASKQKELLRPLDPQNVRMYVCGPTVYDRAHIGNARPVVVFDVLFRLLRHVYGADAVTYARNFTDVDDKINAKSAETGRPIRDITDETIGWYHQDMDALGALRPTHEPRCTEYIAPMVAMTEQLIAKGFAYAAEGHVLFSVDAYDAYGGLSGRSVEDMIAGARVEVAPYKKNPMDFVIWKPSTGDQPGWDSPWGRGRPGWHIECSAMARELLGEVFDIHAGGIDLQFPHHENELAQSCCAHGTERMANFWLHNEMIRVEGQKMSKSLGNFFTVRDLLDKGIPGEVIRLVLLSTHYRSPLDWTESRASVAKGILSKWRKSVEGVEPAPTVPEEFVGAIADDLNTSKAISILHKLAEEKKLPELLASANLLGLLTDELGEWAVPRFVEAGGVKFGTDRATAEMIDRLVQDRSAAKASKDFTRADTLRDALEDAGIIVRDTPDGAVWEFGESVDLGKLEALR
ncbi:MAG: cysteine--tRNA ligase [Pseudomonadota bacterium]